MTSSDLQIVLRERYEQSHGIYNHKASTDPLALVLMHWAEDSITSSTLRDRFEAFLDNQVSQRTGLSWDKFLEMPTYMCDMVLDVLSKRKPDFSLSDIENMTGKK